MASVTTAPDVAEDVLYEVVDGRIVGKPPMGARSSWLTCVLQDHLGPYARSHRLGKVVSELLFRIDSAKGLERRPDLAFVSTDRWPFSRDVPDEAAWEVVPDLAVEVLSPSNSADHVQIKIDDYFEAGVRRIWVVYPRSFKVYDYESPAAARILRLGDELDAAPLLPGFRLPLTALFGTEAE